MAQRRLGAGTLTLRTMLSFELGDHHCAAVSAAFPAGRNRIQVRRSVDGQHPHDFSPMELAAIYDYRIPASGRCCRFYAAPVGDPALGPVAFPHRESASEDPVATLGHHLEDSTHIADEVVTLGFTYRNFRLEGSGFHGREPDEYRWNIDPGGIDSWANTSHRESRSKLEHAGIRWDSYTARKLSFT